MNTQELLRVLKTLNDIDVDDMVPLLTSIYCDSGCSNSCKRCKVFKFVKDLRTITITAGEIIKEVK